MDKRAQAMHMYLNESCTQRHIATTLGVSERTIYTWIRQNSWDRLRQASLAAPVIIADNMCFQLIALQQSIAEREPGKQFPTMHEAEITRKLVMCIDKLKRYPSLTQSMQVLETFRQYVKAGNEKDSWPIDRWMGRFMEARAKGGFRPNDIEYNAENLTPFGLPFDEEVNNDIPATTPAESTIHEAENTKFCQSLNTENPDSDKIRHQQSTSSVTSDQPEILPETDAQSFENQLITCLREPRRTLTDTPDSRKQSEVKSEVGQGTQDYTVPPDFHLQEFVDEIADENLQGQNVSPEIAAAYRQNLALVMETNWLDYTQKSQPEVAPPDTTLRDENQSITPTSDTKESRKQSEDSRFAP